jgi:hypothetical protein
MADTALPVAVRNIEPLSARRARVLRQIEATRDAIAVEWSAVEHAVAGGEARSRAVMGALRSGAKWVAALGALWFLGRRRSRMTWPRAALLAALARAAGRQLIRYWYRGERHVER